MEIKAICTVDFLRIEKGDEPFKFANHTLSDDKNVIKNEFSSADFIFRIGKNLHINLSQSSFFYNITVLNEINYPKFRSISYFVLATINEFIKYLWFIKDNSCNTDFFFNYLPSKKELFSLRADNMYSNCQGQYIDVAFNTIELKRAEQILITVHRTINSPNKGFNEFLEDNKGLKSGPKVGGHHDIEYNSRNRIERALMFLTSTRSNFFIVAKMASYINILEALFITDSRNVTHKISSRVACYACHSQVERNSVYKFIKDIYNIRSKYIHGQKLAPPHVGYSPILEMATYIDKLTREILTRIIMEDSKIFLLPVDEFERWLIELVKSQPIDIT